MDGRLYPSYTWRVRPSHPLLYKYNLRLLVRGPGCITSRRHFRVDEDHKHTASNEHHKYLLTLKGNYWSSNCKTKDSCRSTKARTFIMLHNLSHGRRHGTLCTDSCWESYRLLRNTASKADWKTRVRAANFVSRIFWLAGQTQKQFMMKYTVACLLSHLHDAQKACLNTHATKCATELAQYNPVMPTSD